MTAPNPVASFPVPDQATTGYRMGPLFTPDTANDFWWNTQLSDGSYTACAEPVGWEGVVYVTPLDEVGGRDGAFSGPQSVGPRVLEITALIVSPTAQALRQRIAQLRRVLGPQGATGRRQPVIWEQYDWASGRRLALITRPVGTFAPPVLAGYVPGGLAAQVTFQLVAPNPPWKYTSGSAAETNQVGLADPALIQGRTYNKTFDYTYGAATSIGGEMVCVNNGDLQAWPTFTVTGAVDYPIITNVTTGQEFSIVADLQSGDVVTVESRTGVVSPAATRILGSPFPLAPGANTIRWRSASGVYHADALLRLDWRSTWS